MEGEDRDWKRGCVPVLFGVRPGAVFGFLDCHRYNRCVCDHGRLLRLEGRGTHPSREVDQVDSEAVAQLSELGWKTFKKLTLLAVRDCNAIEMCFSTDES